MSETPPFPDDLLDAPGLVAEARQLAAGLVAFLFNRLKEAPPGPLSLAQIRLFLRTVIKPCEALIRRAIYLLAAQMRPPAARAAPARKPVPPARLPAGGIATPPLVPAFRLTEPQPRPQPGDLPEHLRPRVSIAGTAPPASPRAAPDLAALSARLLRRLAALHAACADPDLCARRLVRRLARNRPAARPLAAAMPTGMRQSRMDDMKSLFERIDHAATRAWSRLCDTS
jgi:hypothetical protein